ncbi:DNA repair protein endonuclease SAE2/CtIP C-terminus-domain-containing protein [Xylaria sp. CBS 124048]|nr:DNA repair protein endonuclease SAE2/CtIP C-terminus-domain-containing protein [Xylaria sp. CBS 124048]
MDNWFSDVGKTILLEAIESACDQINDSLKTEYQAFTEKQSNLATEIETLRYKASQVDRLREENIALQGEIDALREASREYAEAFDTTSRRDAKSVLRAPLASKSANQANSKRLSHADVERLTVSELKTELLRLDQNHVRLRNTCFDLQDALFQSNQLVRERTTACDHWVDHAKQLGEQSLKRAQKIKKLEARLAELSQDSSNVNFSPEVVEPARPIPINPQQTEQLHVFNPNQVLDPPAEPRASIQLHDTGESKSSPITRVLEFGRSASATRASDSRIEDTAYNLPPLPHSQYPTEEKLEIKSEPSSDTPVIVSERPVRKRKYVGPDDTAAGILTAVKTEHIPEPQTISSRWRFAPQESIDFDIEGHRVQTPKKQAKFQRYHGPQTSGGVDILNDDDNAARDLCQPGTQARDNHSPTKHDLYDEDTADLEAANCFRSHSIPGTFPHSLDNNQVLPREPESAPHSRANVSQRLLRGLAGLAEESYQSENKGSSKSLKTRNKPSENILAQLLNTKSRAPDSEIHQPRVVVSENGQPSNLRYLMSQSRELSTGEDKCKSAILAPNASLNTPSNSSSILPTNRNHNCEDKTIDDAKEKEKTEVSLRRVPKASLRLDDFKINLNANEGHNYAYTDVVRNKNDRACLQGCVKENCCGPKFRTLANACRASTSPSEFLSQLESYLGDNCYRLATMSQAEKETLWVEAKMRALANASGRHRHRYPRMPTPPGFWRADFPTTQEGEEYKEKAAEVERQMVEERYREAMRPGGLWVFRDE